MALSPISGTSIGAVPQKTTSENLENMISKLEKQREEVRRQTDSDNKEKMMNALENRLSNLENRLSKLKQREEEQDGECQTCKNRKYQDGSDDPGVSFKNATTISKGAAEAAVRGHEHEHVVREQAKAEMTGREVVSQNVRIKYGICPECGNSYCAGGVTTTVTRAKTEPPVETDNGDENSGFSAKKALENRFSVGMYDEQEEYGKLLNVVA